MTRRRNEGLLKAISEFKLKLACRSAVKFFRYFGPFIFAVALSFVSSSAYASFSAQDEGWIYEWRGACGLTGTYTSVEQACSALNGGSGGCSGWQYTPPGCTAPRTTLWTPFKYIKYTCPSTATLSGSSCTCDGPYIENAAHNGCEACPDGKEFYAPAGKCLSVEDIDVFGQPPKAPLCFGNPIYPMTGAKKEVVRTGFGVGGREFTLTYDSLNRPSTQLWSSNFHPKMEAKAHADGSITVTVARDGRKSGQVIESAGGGSSICGGLPSKSTWVKLAGSELQLKDDATKTVETYSLTGQLTAVKDAFGNVTTPTFSDATTPANVAPAAGYLLKMTDNTGRLISFTYVLQTGAPAATGGLLKTITNAEGQTITLGYDTAWNLSTLTWPDGKVKTFVYEDPVNPWALTGIIDENNSRYSTWTYAPSGHATSSQHAGGVDKGVVTYPETMSTFGAEKIVEEVRGSTLCRFHEHPGGISSVGLTKDGGETISATIDISMGYAQLAGLTQPAGSGCAASNKASTFDVNGNVASQDDFKGMRTCYAYDANTNEITRVEGLANTVMCSTVIDPRSPLPTGARKITTTWHPDWKLPVVVATPGSVSTTVYHGQPDPFNGNAPANCTSAAALPNGKVLPVVCKRVSQATSIASNGVTATIDLPYAQSSLLLHGDGVNGSKVFTDSSATPNTATVFGNAQISTAQSRLGGSSMYFDGASTSYVEFPSASTIVSKGDITIEGWLFPTGNVQQSGAVFGNLANGASNETVLYFGNGYLGWFPNGNLSIWTPQVVPLNLWTHFALVRAGTTCSIYVNGTSTASQACPNSVGSTNTNLRIGSVQWSSAYPYFGFIDDFQIKIARNGSNTGGVTVDASVPSVINQYTYDANGRVLTAKDSLNATTTYTYYPSTAFTGVDPVAVGHTVGDLQTITDPKGFVTTFNSYDKSGRILQMTDPKGIVTDMTYTPRGWIKTVTVTPPGGTARVTTYTYDNVGQITGVLMPDGTSVGYTYDAAHRLIGATDARGNSVTYTLDNVGNRLAEQLKDPGGVLQRTMSRSFDALNRVQQLQLQ